MLFRPFLLFCRLFELQVRPNSFPNLELLGTLVRNKRKKRKKCVSLEPEQSEKSYVFSEVMRRHSIPRVVGVPGTSGQSDCSHARCCLPLSHEDPFSISSYRKKMQPIQGGLHFGFSLTPPPRGRLSPSRTESRGGPPGHAHGCFYTPFLGLGSLNVTGIGQRLHRTERLGCASRPASE